MKKPTRQSLVNVEGYCGIVSGPLVDRVFYREGVPRLGGKVVK